MLMTSNVNGTTAMINETKKTTNDDGTISINDDDDGQTIQELFGSPLMGLTYKYDEDNFINTIRVEISIC